MADQLTVAMVDELMAALSSEWTCSAGFVHQPNTGCRHPMPPGWWERMRQEADGLLARIEVRADG